MTYSIVQPPFSLKFREMPKAELKAYFKWFAEVLPQRVAELESEIRRSSTHATWHADFSRESLGGLGESFAAEVQTRAKSGEEILAATTKLTFPIEVPAEQLTNRTFSLAMDAGMYFSQVILKNLGGTSWDQALRNERFADYGQPAIMGFGSVPLNPVRVLVIVAYRVANDKEGEKPLLELYDTWAAMRQ